MTEILGFIFLIVFFCIFVAMYRRLGTIEIILRETALHQGAIDKEFVREKRWD